MNFAEETVTTLRRLVAYLNTYDLMPEGAGEEQDDRKHEWDCLCEDVRDLLDKLGTVL